MTISFDYDFLLLTRIQNQNNDFFHPYINQLAQCRTQDLKMC